MRTKQILSGLLAAAALCCCMGCEQGGTPSMEPTSELTVYIPPYEEIWMLPVVDLYRETYPEVEVTVKTFTNTAETVESDAIAYQTLLRTELMSGKGPDVVIVNSWTFDDLDKLLQNVPFCDLKKLYEGDAGFPLEELQPAVWAAGRAKDSQVLAPLFYNLPVVMADRAYLQEKQFNFESPMDYTQFMQAAFALAGREGIALKQLFADYQFAAHYAQWMGVSLADYDAATLDLSADALRSGLETFRRVYPEFDANRSFSDTLAAFENLKTDHGKFTVMYKGNGPGETLWNISSLEGIGIRPALLPLRTEALETVALLETAAAIPRASKNARNAYNFIKIMLSEQMQKNNYLPLYPVNSSALQRRIEDYIMHFTALPGDTAVLPSDASLADFQALVKSVGFCARPSALQTRLNQSMAPYFRGEATLEEALKTARQDLQVYLSE